MAKITLNDVASVNASSSTATTINNNMAAIETAFENTLSRDGTTPNTMEANLDMNNHRIINLPNPVSNHEAVNKKYVDNAIDAAVGSGADPQYQLKDPTLNTIASLTPTADQYIYFTAEDQATVGTITSFGRSLLDDTTASEVRTTLGLDSVYQPLDSDLTSIAALTTTSFGRGLLTSANAAALATSAGVGTGDSPQFTAVNLGHASDTTLTRLASGRLAVEGNELGVQRYYDVKTYGATGDGVTNDASAIQSAIDAAEATKGVVLFPAGNYLIGTTSLTMKPYVTLLGLNTPTITYSGSGTMFAASSTTILYRFMMENFDIDEGASAAKVFDLLSAYHCSFKSIRFKGTCVTSLTFNLECNSSGALNTDGNRNVVFNYFSNILHDGACGKLVRMYGLGTDGVSVTAPVRLNTFINLNCRGVRQTGIEFARWCDSNYFAGITRISLLANSAIGVEHNSLNPTVNCGVYANNFSHLAVDTFGTFTGRIGVKMNHCKQNYIGILYQYPLAEGGSLVTTANTTCYFIRYVEELTNTFKIYSDNHFYDKIEIVSGGFINFGDDLNITHSSDTLAFTGAGAAGYTFDSLVTMQRAGVGILSTNTTDAQSNNALILRNAKASAAAANDDTHILFQSKNSSGTQVNYARIKGLTESATASSEIGQIRFGIAVTGTLTDKYFMTATGILPATNDGASLGVGTLSFSDLFLASGGVINWNNGTYTATQSGTNLAFSGTISATNVRETLTANRTYYVRTDGSNSNTGLVNNAGGAFLTIQKALDVIAALDLRTFDVTVQVANGTYTETVRVNGPWVGSGTVTILGDAATPANVVISTTSANAIQVSSAGRLNLSGLKIQTTTSGIGVYASGQSTVTFSGLMDFGACATYHLSADAGATMTFGANYNITGGAGVHVIVTTGAAIVAAGITVTLTGTPAFSTAFAFAGRVGILELYSNTYSGSATGTRYNISTNAVCFVNGAATTYLPGDVAGSTASGGQYA